MESSNPYVETNSLTSDSPPMAGKSFPWKYIDGYYLRVRLFTRFAEMEGDSVGSGVLGVYGVSMPRFRIPTLIPSNESCQS